jgi:hypothetical protein
MRAQQFTFEFCRVATRWKLSKKSVQFVSLIDFKFEKTILEYCQFFKNLNGQSKEEMNFINN